MLRLLKFSFNGDIHWFFLLQTSKWECSENGRVVTIDPEMIGDLLICIFQMAAQRQFGF
jgi:hypothetical protein